MLQNTNLPVTFLFFSQNQESRRIHFINNVKKHIVSFSY